jgi:hypothetical protein
MSLQPFRETLIAKVVGEMSAVSTQKGFPGLPADD